MMPDYFVEDPFPINISSEDIFEFWSSSRPSHHHEQEVIDRLVSEDDLVSLHEAYEEMIDAYMRANFKSGIFCLVRGGHLLLAENKHQPIGEVLSELGIDISHLIGLGESDANLLAIPFGDKDDMEYFGYILRKKYVAEYWIQGGPAGTNQSIGVKETKE